MRKFAFFAPLGLALALAAAPAAAQSVQVSVTVGSELQDKADDLGERDVRDQADRLAEVVARTLNRRGALEGARVELVLTDLKPNRPTYQQLADRPGLDALRSLSIGGAAVEGQVIAADGTVSPIKYDWFSSNLGDVRGFGTWQDADRAYQRLAVNLAEGRYVRR